ncbi:DUF4199 domain-containing protein [Hymenobacter psychrophilus]|uniref:DUF4199 domain-containing protein n=1 Tax=Hymenobacter psychrophilus TaxID=651662 RepID=A0A1H3IMS7_9BACT|nr:DUF4199 domain-containing protein [Hymenobacter psychrophilus]SDY28589.1 Protein of unknown function [Hymenobacter psychrophilus]
MENTTTPAVTPLAVGVRYGLIIGIVSIIVDLVLKASGLAFKFSVSVTVPLLVMVVGIVLAHKFFKRSNGGYMSYGQGLLIAIVLGSISALFTGIFNYVYINFIDTTYVDAMRTDMETWMASKNMPEEQIEMSLKDISQEKLGAPFAIAKAIFGGAIGGLVLSLIVSAFTKSKRPEFE